MEREELDELHYIAHIDNIPLILKLGILSHNQIRSRDIQHQSVALEGVQEIRADRIVPNARRLHDYVNLYINARNPMLYKLRSMHRTLSILRVSPEVLDLDGVVISDQNAARGLVRFHPAPDGLEFIDIDDVFAKSWTQHDNDHDIYQHRGRMCAEVLVPDMVDSEYIIGAWVSYQETQDRILADNKELEVDVNCYLFFLT